MVEKLVFARNNPDRVARCVEDAREWVQSPDWRRVLEDRWLPLFEEAALR